MDRGRDTADRRVTSSPEDGNSGLAPPRPMSEPRASPISGYESPNENNTLPSHARPSLRPGQWPSSRDPRARGSGTDQSPPSPDDQSETRNRNGMVSSTGEKPRHRVAFRDRIAHYRWTWFTMNMATGGIANVLYSIPFRSQWLYGIGLAFFFLNLVLFVMNCICITLRFIWNPGTLINSFIDQFESLFVPSFLVALATIFTTICQYGIPSTGPWLLEVMEVIYWIYVGLSVFGSAGMYLTLWSTQAFPIHTMTPVWVFPAYPLLLTAPFGASVIAGAIKIGRVSNINTIGIALSAVTVQGTGFLIGFTICAAFIYRLMTQKLPRDAQRPGVFISVGPSSFTAAGIVQLGLQAPEIFPPDFIGATNAISILRLLAYMSALWLWGLSLWFFLVSVGSLWKYINPKSNARIPFQMTWFSFVFPNTALVVSTEQLGTAFGSRGLQIFGCVLACGIILVWLLVVGNMLRGLWTNELLWPKDTE